MKRRKALKLIFKYLPTVHHAVLLKEKNGYTVAFNLDCVNYQRKMNPGRIDSIYHQKGNTITVTVNK